MIYVSSTPEEHKPDQKELFKAREEKRFREAWGQAAFQTMLHGYTKGVARRRRRTFKRMGRM